MTDPNSTRSEAGAQRRQQRVKLQPANSGAKRRLKVLISAYACEPGEGSEPAVGWNIAREMARHHEIWVLTRANNRDIIEDEFTTHPVADLHFIYHDLPNWARWWKKGSRGVQLYYYFWQLTAIAKVRRKHAEVGFDISHHVTFVKYWAPSCLAWLDIPFVWGPVGGGDSTPFRFISEAGWKGFIHEIARDVSRWLSYFDPLIRYTARQCTACIPVTPKTAQAVRKLSPSIHLHGMTQVGMSKGDLERIDRIAGDKPSAAAPLDFLYVGNLIFLKGVHLALKAFAKANIPNSRFVIAGDGSEMKRLGELAQELGVAENVIFRGRLSMSEVLHAMSNASVLIHLSLHDSGGFVPLEAMACRKPVICLDLAGPAVLVTEECGALIPALNPSQVIDDVATAMREMSADPARRLTMGCFGRVRVESDFLWCEKANVLCHVYSDLVGGDELL